MTDSVCGTKIAATLVTLRVWYSVTLPQHKLSANDGDRREDFASVQSLVTHVPKVKSNS